MTELTYEEARTELAGVVEKLEAGGATLEQSLALWERGEELAAICQRWLDAARARLDGARAAMDAAGVPLDPALVRTGLWFAFEDGLNHARELLRLPDPPTALLCGNDLQALGACEAARRAGLRIPQDLSVVGFDDIPPASWCGPALTTVRQPFTEMGAAAAGMVVSMAAGRPPERTRVELPTTLIVRDSTAPPSP
ncbi:hypothetical protein GCM10009557_51710 [Virgisporangium ochraceum]